MSLACKRSCRKCFPNGCCGFCKPPPQVQRQVDTVIQLEKKVDKDNTRSGAIVFYPGVRTSENEYTCPMLSVHLYRHSEHKANIGQDNRTITVQGTNDQFVLQGPRHLIAEDKTSAEEEIIMIPVEDVVSIGSNLEVVKGLQADVNSEQIPTYDFRPNCCDNCWNSTKKRCQNACGCCQKAIKVAPLVRNTTVVYDDPNRNTRVEETDVPFSPAKKECCDSCRCWCCKKRVLTRLIKRSIIKEERSAKRVITVTIQYSKYSNPNTPSHTRLLKEEHQSAYYKETFNAENVLKFYLINNTEFDPVNFGLRKNEAETLCRTVMQLKAMKGQYPSERELDHILDLAYKRIFGDLYREPTLHIPVASSLPPAIQSSRSTQPIAQAPQRPAIEQQPNPTTVQQKISATAFTNENSDEKMIEKLD